MRLVGLVAGAAATALVAVGAITYAVAEGDTGAGAGGRTASASVSESGDGTESGGGSGSGLTPPAADSADAGFARDMAVHHQQAVEMSYIVRDRTKDTEVRRLAYDIAQTQANQRGMLLGWLDLWGLPKVSAGPPMAWMGMNAPAGEDGALMPGMATDAQMKRLGQLDGRQAEMYYLRLMTAHHKGGIHMAEGCVAKCAVGVERRLAQGMVDAQQSEIRMMADMLKKRGATGGF
ncbi:DUF305 domain-containing protein [Streptomyces anandii]|uniref:DUF305 domain-containing protein n=1 Tax=Streptomyces anandii TaxID=285454 RepID=UPI001673D455|nr:DUF305 domain-containing protein [Streptomyces anandii]GGX62063.1 hypothetical protein GCM10010510_03020 [Streptomyces anandii JCM 4720]